LFLLALNHPGKCSSFEQVGYTVQRPEKYWHESLSDCKKYIHKIITNFKKGGLVIESETLVSDDDTHGTAQFNTYKFVKLYMCFSGLDDNSVDKKFQQASLQTLLCEK